MVPRLLTVCILAIAASASARADCTEAVSEVDQLICGDAGLRQFETKISTAYDEAWSRVADADRSVLAEEQRLWLMRRRNICSRGTAPNATEERKLKCLNGWAASRLERLQQWPQLGRPQMLVESPPGKVCLAGLERSNIGWSWDIVDSQDRFDPLLPPGAKQPAWAIISTNPNIRYAQFDLLNEGTARDVYLIESDPDARIQFQWYVVAAADERELIKRRIESLIKAPREDIDALAKELRRDKIEGYGYGSSAFDDIFGESSKPGTLQSVLVEAANSTFFRGAYARSRAFSVDNVTYILGADYRGAIALLRPDTEGSLIALCRHDAVPSINKANISITSAAFQCPYQTDTAPIAWQGEDAWDMHAPVELEEWGGKRIVASRMQSAGMYFATTRIAISDLNSASPPGENQWAPLSAVDENHDSTELMLTSGGPYIGVIDWLPYRPSDSPLGKTYYRIIDNRLIEACHVTEERVPPAGYAVSN